MEFDDLFTRGALPLLFRFFGKAATHYTETGTSTTCTVVVRPFAGAVDNVDRADFFVQQSEVSSLLRGHYFVLSGDTQQWPVSDVKSKGGFHRGHCESKIGRL